MRTLVYEAGKVRNAVLFKRLIAKETVHLKKVWNQMLAEGGDFEIDSDLLQEMAERSEAQWAEAAKQSLVAAANRFGKWDIWADDSKA